MHMCTEGEGVSKEKGTGGFIGLNRAPGWPGASSKMSSSQKIHSHFAPYTYMQLKPYTADRVCWQGIVDLPTSKELSTEE